MGLRFVPFHDLSSSGDQVLGESTLPRCGASYHHPGPSYSVSRARPSPGCRVSLLGGLISVCDPHSDVNRPESQEVLVRNWKPVSSLVGECRLWGRVCPFPALAGARLPPASSGGWAGPQPASSSLVLLSPLFCELAAGPSVRAFLGIVLMLSLFFSPLSLVIPQFRLLSHIISLRLPSGH